VTQPPLPENTPELITVYDRETGEGIDVAPAQAKEALRSGRYGLPKGASLPMVNEATGAIEQVGVADAMQRVHTGGAVVASPRELAAQSLRQSYDNAGDKALAAGTGFVNSLALGFGDAGVAKLGDALGQGKAIRRELQNQREYLPGYRMGGEAAGFLAPALVSGGSSLGARGLTAGARGATALGAGVEGLAARGLARAGMAEGGILARGLSTAAGQAVEMGIYGAGEGTSRAVLANPELSGEAALAAAGQGFAHGALFGAAGGALLGGGGALLRGVGRGALDGATGLAEKLTGRVSEKAAGTVGEQTTKLLDTLAPGGLGEYATAKALKSTGANQSILGKAEALSPELREIAARQIVSDLPKALGREEGAILSHVEQAEASALAKEAAGKSKAALVDELHAAGVKADVPGLVAELRAKLEPLAGGISRDAQRAAREGEFLLGGIEKKLAEGDVKALWKQQKDLGNEMKETWNRFRKGEATLVDQIKADAYFGLGGALEKAGEKAEGLGAEFVGKWKQANKEYHAADWVDKAVGKGAERDLANRTAGLSEQLGGLGGSSTGASIGGSIAGPLGAGIGSAIGGIAGAAAQHLVKKYGDQAVASALRKTIGSGDVAAAGALLLEQHVSKSVLGFFKTAGEKSVAVGGRAVRGAELAAAEAEPRRQQKEALEKRYTRASNGALAAASAVPARTAQIAQRMAGSSPQAIAAAQAAHVRAVQLVASKVPPMPTSQTSLTPHLDKVAPPPSEMAAFMRTAQAVDDPTSVLDSLKRGDITTEEVEALKTVYPQMYAKVQEQVMAQLSELREPLPYGKALALGTLLGVPAHPSLAPDFIKATQATFAPQPQPDAAPARGKTVNIAKSYSLETEPA
jgi:hypothetical protein